MHVDVPRGNENYKLHITQFLAMFLIHKQFVLNVLIHETYFSYMIES